MIYNVYFEVPGWVILLGHLPEQQGKKQLNNTRYDNGEYHVWFTEEHTILRCQSIFGFCFLACLFVLCFFVFLSRVVGGLIEDIFMPAFTMVIEETIGAQKNKKDILRCSCRLHEGEACLFLSIFLPILSLCWLISLMSLV